MVARPRFDFVGSLELCRKLRTLADDIDKGASTRKTGRDIAVAEGSFQGPYGDDHRARATGEDVLTDAIVDALDEGAKAWARAWRTAANEMNDYAFYLAQQQRDSMYASQIWAWGESATYDPDTETYTYGPQPTKGYVTPPKPAPIPPGPTYEAPAAFADYYPSGNNMYASYITSPSV